MSVITVKTPNQSINAPLASNTAQTVNITLVQQTVTVNNSGNTLNVLVTPVYFPYQNSSFVLPSQNVGIAINSAANTISYNVVSASNTSNSIVINTNTRNPSIINVRNRVGVNFQTWDGFEAIPTMQNRVLECRAFQGFNVANGVSTSVDIDTSNLTAQGWPKIDFDVGLREGATLDYHWIGANGSNITLSCGFTGSGHENLQPMLFCSLSNVVQNTTTGNTTFNLTPTGNVFGFSVANVSVPVTQIYAWLPGYAHPGYVDEANTGYLFTNEAIRHWSQFEHIRFMQAQQAWSNGYYPYGANARPTPQNSKARFPNVLSPLDTFSYVAPGSAKEPTSVELFAQFCKACNTGIWINIPIGDDGTYSAQVANVLANTMGTLPVYVEISNELWNGALGGPTGLAAISLMYAQANPGVLDDPNFQQKNAYSSNITGITANSNAVVTMDFVGSTNPFTVNEVLYLNNVGGMIQMSNTQAKVLAIGGSNGSFTVTLNTNSATFSAFTSGGIISDLNTLKWRYLTILIHNTSVIFKNAFGSRFANTCKMVFATQAAQAATYFDSNMAPFMIYKYGLPLNQWIQVFCGATYITRNNWGVDKDPANVAIDYLANSVQSGYINSAERTKARCLVYGLDLVTYEGGYGADTNSTEWKLPNVALAYTRSEMQAVTANIISYQLASGVDAITWFQGGATSAPVSGNGYTNILQLGYSWSNDYPSLMNTSSYKLNAAWQYFASEPGTIASGPISINYTPRNLITKKGDMFSGNNYLDNLVTSGVAPNLQNLPGGSPPMIPGMFYGVTSANGSGGLPYSFLNNPFHGIIGYLFYSTILNNLTLNVTPWLTVNSTQTMNVIINGANVINSVAITNNVVNTAQTLGTANIKYGWNYIEFHTDTFANITFNALQFN